MFSYWSKSTDKQVIKLVNYFRCDIDGSDRGDALYRGTRGDCPSRELYMQVSHLLRVHTEWQLPLHGVHSIMMEKLAQASVGRGCTPTPFHCIYHHIQSCSVRSSWVGRYTHPISSLQIYVLYGYAQNTSTKLYVHEFGFCTVVETLCTGGTLQMKDRWKSIINV